MRREEKPARFAERAGSLKSHCGEKGGRAVTGGGYSKPGDPDLIACFRGRYVAIEAKTPTGAQSPIQKKRMKEIQEAGGIYILARSVEDVAEVIEELWAEQDYDI